MNYRSCKDDQALLRQRIEEAFYRAVLGCGGRVSRNEIVELFNGRSVYLVSQLQAAQSPEVRRSCKVMLAMNIDAFRRLSAHLGEMSAALAAALEEAYRIPRLEVLTVGEG